MSRQNYLPRGGPGIVIPILLLVVGYSIERVFRHLWYLRMSDTETEEMSTRPICPNPFFKSYETSLLSPFVL